MPDTHQFSSFPHPDCCRGNSLLKGLSGDGMPSLPPLEGGGRVGGGAAGTLAPVPLAPLG